MNLEKNKWIVFPKKHESKISPKKVLICFAHSGGGASVYHHWEKLLSPEIEIWRVQLPGREERWDERLERSMPELIAKICDGLTLSLRNIHIPYLFFGHSLGSLVTFETARELRRRNMKLPQQLIVSGREAPQCPDPDPPIRDLPEKEFLIELRKYEGTPESFFQDPDLIKFFLPILRADFTLGETYQYRDEPPLDCPLTVYGSVADPNLTTEGLRAWEKQTTNDFQLRMFEGHHFYLHERQPIFFQTLAKDCLKY